MKKVAGIIRRNKRRKWMKAGVMSAACIVVFVTTWRAELPKASLPGSGQIRELIYEGEDYTIRLAGGADVHLPEDAYLSVREIEKDSDEYQMYLAASGAALQRESGNVEARFFDITIMSGGEAIEPEGTVSVDISYHDVLPLTEDSEIGVVHFADEAETGAVLQNTTESSGEGQAVIFAADGFSVYSIVDAPAPAVSANEKAVNDQSRLEGMDMLIRADVLNNKGILLVSENSGIQEWTFESIEKDKYYIKTTVDGAEKYLNINNGNVTLVDQADASQIQAIPGTGASKGKWHFTVNNYSLNYTGSAANGFNAANNSNATTWLNLVERSTLTEDDFAYYSARKISASDDLLGADAEEKAKVIVYTRVWNNDTSRYDYYAVDHDGSLVRVYDSGDKINWVGNQVNSTLWEFTEYTNADGTPNYYYEK